jgi:myo-inositol 2-dehydrogenase/D-chiro-inositol 1-dehydrogenase
MARWLLGISAQVGVKKQVKRVLASGINARHPELEKSGDADNALAVVEFENNTSCTFHLSRTAIHGHECQTEIYGQDGKFIVNGVGLIYRSFLGFFFREEVLY